MKRILNKLERDEKGQALLIVLILLVIGGLIIGPLLGFMSTGLIVGQAYEWRMDELYAADAGVEDALHKIITDNASLPGAGDDPPMEYSIDDVNGKEFVDDPIIITYIDERTYKIESTATSPDTGSSTTIKSHIHILNFTDFTQNAITSQGDVHIWSNASVNGTVQCDPAKLDNKGMMNPPIADPTPIVGWPTPKQMSDWYWNDVKSLPGFGSDQIVINSASYSIPSLQRTVAGANFDIRSTKKDAVATVEGTIFIDGNLKIGQSAQGFTLDLNGKTIFATGYIDIGGQTTLTGDGAIIALGDVFFAPKISSSPDNFIFVMSVTGTLTFNPGAPSTDFYGSLAGNVDVTLQPGKILIWTSPVPDLNVPWQNSDRNIISEIITWEISLQ